MNSTLIFGLAAAATLGLAGAAQAQTTTTESHMRPNGAEVTSATRTGPGGSATTRTVTRPDGTQVVHRRVTDLNGDTRSVHHVRGTNSYRVCRTMWRHGERVRRCMMRQR